MNPATEHLQPLSPKQRPERRPSSPRRDSRFAGETQQPVRPIVIGLSRLVLALPNPLGLAFVWCQPSLHCTIVADLVRQAVFVLGVISFGYSRMLTGARHVGASEGMTLSKPRWGVVDYVELLLNYVPHETLSLVVFSSSLSHGQHQDFFVSVCVGTFFILGIAFIVDDALLAIAQAQKDMLSGYIFDQTRSFLAVWALGCLLLLYSVMSLARSAYNLEQSAVFIDLALSANFSCSEQAAFTTLFTNATGEPLCAPSHPASWCDTEDGWKAACWTVALAPVAKGVYYDVFLVLMQAAAILAAVQWIFGRGLVRKSASGQLDPASVVFITSPRVLLCLLVLALTSAIALFHLARLPLDASMLVTPRPTGLWNGVDYRSSCLGSCDKHLYYAFAGLWAIALFAGALELVKSCLCVNNEQRNRRLSMGVLTVDDLLSSDEKWTLLQKLDAATTDGAATTDRFTSVELRTGHLQEAAGGLGAYLGVSEAKMRAALADGEASILAEVKAYGEAEVTELLHYVMHEAASEKEYANGVRDEGRHGETLEDFMQMEEAKSARLDRAHVIALRLYTTAAFKHINMPLRDAARRVEGRAHPLPATVAHIHDGIKKLRMVEADTWAVGMERTLWRGMKGLYPSEDFLIGGGAEQAPMSTTRDIGVAAAYSCSLAGSLIFKIRVPNALQHGASLQWLSAFPKEEEVLYPPLTFLQPVREGSGHSKVTRVQTIRSEQSGAEATIIEVMPDLSS
jgi:hypothetical protein